MLYRICEALSVSADNILGITSDAGESDFVEWKKRALLAEAKLETIKAVMRKLIDE